MNCKLCRWSYDETCIRKTNIELWLKDQPCKKGSTTKKLLNEVKK